MLLAKIVGSVVVTQKIESLSGKKLMLARAATTSDDGEVVELTGGEIVAVDTVGCGRGDLVLLSKGTPAQSCFSANNQGIDYAVVGIIDTINKY